MNNTKRLHLSTRKASFLQKLRSVTHACGWYEEAIEVLRRGDQFDELVTYANSVFIPIPLPATLITQY